MRILQVIPYFYPAWKVGGSAKVAYDICRKLVERGHSITVYTSDIKDVYTRTNNTFEKIDGVTIFYFKNLSLFTARRKIFITPSLISAVRNNIKSFDIVHIHGNRTTQGPILHHFLKKINVPYIVQAHGGLPRINGRKINWVYDIFFGYRLLKDATRVIALNRVEAEQYRAMGVSEEKIAIIPNGIDLSEYTELPPKGSFKKKFNIPEDRKIILYLGRIHKIKGIDFLVKAYAYLKNKMNFKNTVLVVAGPDDGYLSETKALAYTLRVSDSVMFIGPLYGRDKLAAYVDSDLCVLPSRYETFPIALLEVYACSKPIVASNLQGLKELIVDGETGLLFETGNFKQMAEKMVYLLNDNNKAAEIGMKARGLVEERYSIDRVVDNLEELYMEIAS
jgi:glycosyltransferase involved in cell wall biosynthesis